MAAQAAHPRRPDRCSLTAQSGRAQLTIRSGDQIVVPRRANFFREYIAPAASVTSAVVALANLVIRNF